MSNLYTFNKKGIPAKFFHWVWGVWPHIKFKTMCPYFWSFVGTLLISPVLVPIVGLIKLITGVPESKLGTWIEQAGEACDDYKRKRKRVKAEREQAREGRLFDEAIRAFVRFLNFPTLEHAQAMVRVDQRQEEYNRLDRYQVQYDSRYYEKIAEFNKDILDEETRISYGDAFYNAINMIQRHEQEVRMERIARAQKAHETRKEVAEKVASNPVVKVIISIFIAIGIMVGSVLAIGAVAGALYLIYLGLGWWFSRYALETAIGVASVIGLAGLIWCVHRIIRCWGDVISAGIGKFFRSIGKGLVTIFTPVGHAFAFVGGRMGWLVAVLEAIASGFEITINMIVATYKKYCPMITWTDEE